MHWLWVLRCWRTGLHIFPSQHEDMDALYCFILSVLPCDTVG